MEPKCQCVLGGDGVRKELTEAGKKFRYNRLFPFYNLNITHRVVNREAAESLAFGAIWSCAQPAVERKSL